MTIELILACTPKVPKRIEQETGIFKRLNTIFHMVKGISDAFDLLKFCLVINLKTTAMSDKRALVWSPFLLLDM